MGTEVVPHQDDGTAELPVRAEESGRGSEWASVPADAFLAADAGAFAALSGQDVGVAGIGVAPAQIGGQGSRLPGVGEVLGVGEGELPQRPEVRLDRVRPGGVGRGEVQLDLVLFAPLWAERLSRIT